MSTPEFPYVATMSAPNLVASAMENAMRAAITGDYNAFKSAFKNFLLIEKTDDDCLCDNIDINARDYQYGYNLAHCAALGGNIDNPSHLYQYYHTNNHRLFFQLTENF